MQGQFSKRLRAERELRGWSQPQVARLLLKHGIDLHFTAIAKIESGERAVRIEEAAAIADVFDVPLDAMLGRSAGRGPALGYAVRSAVDVTRRAARQTTTTADELDGALADLDALEFDGGEELAASVRDAQKSLRAAADALETAARFVWPARGRVKLRKDLTVPETRTVYVAEEKQD